MKNISKLLMFGAIMVPSLSSFAQDLTNREKLNALSEQWSIKYQIDLAEAVAEAEINGWPTYGIERISQFGVPIYSASENNDAAAETGTTDLRSNFNVDGTGMTIGIWECCNDGMTDGNVPRLTHQDFQSRITIKDGTSSSEHSGHATHVAGTLLGSPPSGISQDSKGMAIEADGDAYGILNDASEMATAGAATIEEVENGKLLVSNHSYGNVVGWAVVGGDDVWIGGSSPFNQNSSSSYFGRYNAAAEDWDDVALLAPYYLICKSAGNDRGDGPATGATVTHWETGNEYTYDPAIHPGKDGGTDGFDCIPHKGNAKNILTVGAVNKSSSISSFSGFGPTDDGRVKPDICGVGVSMLSSWNTANTAYATTSGTSMSSPQVAGSLLLLQEMYSDKFKVGADRLYMRAATLKALAINTSTDKGNTGPDYKYGFGVLDAKKAGETIFGDAEIDSSDAVIIEGTLDSNNLQFDYFFNIAANADLRATLVYADPSGSTLVNDLDLVVKKVSGGTDLHEWKLDPNNPNDDAIRADNDIDNVKHFSSDGLSLASGKYRARVAVEGNLFMNENQTFSLVISGMLTTSCKATIYHKLIDLPSNTYTAQDKIVSSAIASSGKQVTYKSDGPIILQPGFHAKEQNSTGTGYFKTTSGSCN